MLDMWLVRLNIWQLLDVFAIGLLIHNSSVVPPLNWDTKINSILPAFELMDPMSTKHTTITDIISHRTGLPRHDLMYSFSDDVLSLVSHLSLPSYYEHAPHFIS
jgi:hypothetical protein